jgi:hypothetical protein
MIDPREFAILDANASQFLASQRAAQAQPKKKGGRGGFLTSLISEGGAIGGGAAGAAAGSAILPGIGTLLGGALGAGIGAFGGRVAENKVRDDRLGIGDAAKEGALSAVFGGGPIRLAKAGVETVKGATKGGLSLADALAQAGEKAVGMNARQAAGNKLAQAGEGLIAKEFRLNPTQQANFKKLTGEEAVSVLRRYNVKRPEDLQERIRPLQDAFDGVVDTIPAATKAEVKEAMQKVYAPLLKSSVLTRQQLGQSLKAQADEILKKSGNQVSAADLNTLRKSFDDAVTYTQRGTNEFTVNKKSADALRKLLQTKADAAGITADGRTFKDIGLELRKLRNLDEVVGKQQYLGTGSLPLSIPQLLGSGVGGITGGLPGALAGIVGTQAINSNAGRRLAANGLLGAGEKLSTRAANKNPYSLGAVAGRVAPVGLAGALIGAQSEGQSMATSAPMTSTASMPSIVQNMPELSQADANMSTDSSPFAPENLQSSVQQILANGGTMKDAAEFVGLAEALQKIQGGTQPKPLTASQATRAAAANNALRDIPMIMDAIESGKLGGAKALPGSGTQIGRRILGTENLDAALFNIADNILRARTGAAAPEAEVKRFVDTFLPAATDSKQAKLDKLARAIRELQGYVNPMEASADTLEELVPQL